MARLSRSISGCGEHGMKHGPYPPVSCALLLLKFSLWCPQERPVNGQIEPQQPPQPLLPGSASGPLDPIQTGLRPDARRLASCLSPSPRVDPQRLPSCGGLGEMNEASSANSAGMRNVLSAGRVHMPPLAQLGRERNAHMLPQEMRRQNLQVQLTMRFVMSP